MTIFYAYIHNIRDDNTWRLVLIFASRAIADQWWRAISTSLQAAFVQRISPQFYTHDAQQCNVFEFFTHTRFKPMSEQFRGKMFLTLMNDRGGRTISIIPPQEITDHISGNWFYIRSKTNRALYWHHREDNGKIFISEKGRTRFRVKGHNLAEGTIMIGTDQITLHIADQVGVDVEKAGTLVAARVPREFKFDDLENGSFSAEGDGTLIYDGSDSRKGGWELV